MHEHADAGAETHAVPTAKAEDTVRARVLRTRVRVAACAPACAWR